MLREVKKLKFLDKAMFEKGNLEVEIIWKDSDLLEIYTKASNGRYVEQQKFIQVKII